METKDDVQLIRRILSGDDAAFNALVRKHQKGIHALAWRKVGDFHIAEEIVQDTFLQVYKHLAQLKNPNQFSGWMYVIASRLCLKWLQKNKNKSAMQSLEDTPVAEIEESSYTHYVSEQRLTESTERRHELVKKLLAQLPESERTVVTLHFLGEMTAKEIGKLLGVSVNTIKSRLRRGRKRLQEQREELLVSETLGSLPFPAHVTERIMEQVAHMKPTPAPVGKPLVPWMAFGTAVVFVILVLGASNQYLARFQKPYSFEAESEPTIEIVDAPIVLDIVSKPSIRNQFGQATTPGKSSSAGMQVSEAVLRSSTLEDSLQFGTSSQWTQGNAPPGGRIQDIFATSEGTVYAVAPTGIYRSEVDATAWTRVNASVPIGESRMPMAEHNGSLYIASVDEIFTSADRGETWYTLGPRPKGHTIGLIITDGPQDVSSQVDLTMYLALRDEGVFRSTDGGTHWHPLNDGLTGEIISAVAVVGKTIFTGTGRGLYRLDSGVWTKLPVETSRAIYSLAVSENNLYVGTGPELLGLTPIETGQVVPTSTSPSIKFFHSADLGASWTEITPSSKTVWRIPSGMLVLAAGETLFASSAMHQYRSTDNGQTWIELSGDTDMIMVNSLPAVVVNEKTFYKAGPFGIFRTTDGGKSWPLLIDGMAGTRLKDLVVFNNRLYAHTGFGVYQSTDEGMSWKKLSIMATAKGTMIIHGPSQPNKAHIYNFFDSKLVVANNNLYCLSPKDNRLLIVRLSTDSDTRSSPVRSIPTFDDEASPGKLQTSSEKTKRYSLSNSSTRDPLSIVSPPVPGGSCVNARRVVVCNDAFYVEHERTLFKWRLGDSEWTNTGLTDRGPSFNDDFRMELKLAVSGETVYVGKRDGKLFQSLDGGNSWRDVTPSLPLYFARFKEITFVGSTVYVATDEGVLSSETGAHWRLITDSAGERAIIDKFAMNGTKVYGIGDAGIYRLDARSQWKQVASDVPDEINALAIANNKLYSATEDRGILHIALEEE
ncbi:sigma-70 family RNA polymerase sigma factor [Candidatus Poribacteria bacterium]|nr:sigma-70 family RNA polymerase sigma factor [Candidatus Poribacteria bacterium]